MRALGVDFGFRRIGLAVAETEHRIVTPRNVMMASGSLKKDAQAISALARKEEAKTIVVGLPLEGEGEEGRMAGICRQLAGHLEALGFVVDLVDERLTSVQAESALYEGGLKASQRRKRRDGEAACLILERYLDETASS